MAGTHKWCDLESCFSGTPDTGTSVCNQEAGGRYGFCGCDQEAPGTVAGTIPGKGSSLGINDLLVGGNGVCCKVGTGNDGKRDVAPGALLDICTSEAKGTVEGEQSQRGGEARWSHRDGGGVSGAEALGGKIWSP